MAQAQPVSSSSEPAQIPALESSHAPIATDSAEKPKQAKKAKAAVAATGYPLEVRELATRSGGQLLTLNLLLAAATSSRIFRSSAENLQ